MLEPLGFAMLDPALEGLGECDTGRGRRVCTLLNLMQRANAPRFGFLFCGECPDMALAGLIGVIDDPLCLFNAVRRRPSPFANACHFRPLLELKYFSIEPRC